MSLLSTASPWQNDSNTRIPRIPKPVFETPLNSSTKTEKVDSIRQQMAAISTTQDSTLADFKPLPTKIPMRAPPPPPPPSATKSGVSFAPADSNPMLSNYMQIYGPSNGGFGGGSSVVPSGGTDILTQKMNYLIFMMEEQQYERTANVTEEFILYLFLGVFVIYTLDSFARIGRNMPSR
jgi:hypothetical protein